MGLANLTCNFIGVSILLGINGATATLVSQSYGVGELALCGVYLNRGRIILAIVYIPICAIFFFTEPILIAIGQDPIVAAHAQHITYYLMVSTFLLG